MFIVRCSFFLALVVLIYIPSMFNRYIWDDPQYVVDNPTLKSLDGLWRIWTDPTATPQYYPMVHTTFWIEAHLWGVDHPAGFHIDNILLHALAVVLLWRALSMLKIPGAWLAAAIFAVHPVMVESVAWVTERKNVLSIVFYLLAFHTYFRSGLMNLSGAPDIHPGHPGLLRKNRLYLLSIALFLLALLSKTVTCSLPAAILLLIWWKRGKLIWADAKPLLPMLLLGLIFSGVTSHLEHTRVGARGPDFDWSPIDRCLIAGHAICFYAAKIVWPHPLLFMYPKWNLHVDLIRQFIYPAVVLLTVALLWLSRRFIGRGALTAVLFFTGTLFPALGFVNVYPMRYSFVADHFQYLAAIGLIVLIAAGLSRFSKFTAVILLPLMVLTWRQQHIYYDAQTLWENTIAQNETCWMAHTNLAGTLRSQKQLEAAMQQSKRALELAPSEADTHYDYGVALARASRWNDAIAEFRSAIACDPQCAVAFSDLGRVLWDHDDSATAQAEAYAAAKRAIEINPNLADPHYVFACVAELSGNLPNAIDEYQKALEIEPEDFHSHFNLGLCLLQTGQFGEAAGEFQKVVNHDPGNAPAWNYLGDAYVRAGKTAEAAGFYRRALSIDPSLPSARQALEKRHAE